MPGPAGSFYLDSPATQPSTGEVVSRVRAVSASVLAFIGISSMAVAALLSGAHFLFSDATPALSAIAAVINDPVAHVELQGEIGTAISDRLVGTETAKLASDYGLDVKENSVELAGAVLDDATFRATVDEAIIDAHSAIFGGNRSAQINISAITQSIVDVIAVESDQMTVLIDPNADIATIDATDLPDMSAALDFVDHLLLIAMVGLVGIPLAAVIHPKTHRVLSWTGRALLVIGLIGLAVAVGGPPLAGRITGWTATEVALRTITVRFIVPTVTIALSGIGFMSIAAGLRHVETTTNTNYGAVAALGIGQDPEADYLPQPAALSGPRFVGTGQQLTSI